MSLINTALVLGGVWCLAVEALAFSLPAVAPKVLVPVGTLDAPAIVEASGLTASRRFAQILWTHNDSGDRARIFAVTDRGRLVMPAGSDAAAYQGVQVPGAVNVDWEDIAADNKGRLYLGAFGNNSNARTDLGVYVIREPDPFRSATAEVLAFWPFRFPDQRHFPDPEKNFDAEALFTAGDCVYILSKNRGDRQTRLYRLVPKNSTTAAITLIDRFAIGGLVTAADATADGRRIVVLTYKALWLFSALTTEGWFQGSVAWLPLANAKKCEGVCFMDEAIMIANEQGDLFKVKVDELITVRP